MHLLVWTEQKQELLLGKYNKNGSTLIVQSTHLFEFN